MYSVEPPDPERHDRHIGGLLREDICDNAADDGTELKAWAEKPKA